MYCYYIIVKHRFEKLIHLLQNSVINIYFLPSLSRSVKSVLDSSFPLWPNVYRKNSKES